jgi:phosphoglycerate dehydrogenase-like enzyme
VTTAVAEARVAVIAEPRAERLLGSIIATLRERGCTVDRYASAAEAMTGAERESTTVILAMGEVPCDGALFAAYPKLRLVASAVIGYERIDVQAATERGIAVANAYSAATVESMAEATIMLMLAALYELPRALALFDAEGSQPPFARMLKGRTVGLIGFGAIGRAIAQRLAGWNVSVLANARRPLTDLSAHVRSVDLAELVAESDVVALVASLNAESRHVLNEARLRALKPGAVVVNTSRGGLIDEDALAAVLRDRSDLRVALDTFETFPLPAASPLRAVQGAILTPHRIGHTRDAIAGLQQMSVDNVLAALAGELPPGLRNQPAYAKESS